jgi:hypothetical protein
MKSFVKSKPDADFLARLLVLMISPLGSTTVWFHEHQNGIYGRRDTN